MERGPHLYSESSGPCNDGYYATFAKNLEFLNSGPGGFLASGAGVNTITVYGVR